MDSLRRPSGSGRHRKTGRRSMRRILAATVASAVGLAIGGGAIPSVASAHGGSPSDTPPPMSWGPCTAASLKSRNAQSGLLTVPLDYAHPGGTKIKIAVSRINHKSSAADYQGVMLVNPGGPGGSGLTLAVLGDYVPDGVGGDYDWIGFDPRGVGSSTPRLSCVPDYFVGPRPPFVPNTDEILAAWLTRTEQFVSGCIAHSHGLLPHMRTTDSARD